jgi:hypothetical protein
MTVAPFPFCDPGLESAWGEDVQLAYARFISKAKFGDVFVPPLPPAA